MTSDQPGASSGWYPPDPSNPREIRYWDGTAWTEHRYTYGATTSTTDSGDQSSAPVIATSGAPVGVQQGWWTSWPAIIVGLLLGVIPGIVLLWMRRGPQTWAKVAASVVAVPLFFILLGSAAVATAPDTDTATPAAETSASASATPSPTPTPTTSPSATPSPSPEPVVTPSPEPSLGSQAESDWHAQQALASGDDYVTAEAAALELTVKGRAPKTGYSREQFGAGWVDVDQNGCDTRNDMLQVRLSNLEMSGPCKVISGDLADPFTAAWIHFEYGGTSEVDVDHLVALSDAWQKGAATWEFAKRVAFANDPLNLEPVEASANRQKGDGDAATWLPANTSYRCHYVARQIAVKTKYEVWVTQAELDAMLRVLDTCPGQPLPSAGDQPIIAANTGGPAPTPKPTETKTSEPAPAPAPTETKTSEPAPAQTAEKPSNPGDSKNCGDFSTWTSAQDWYLTHLPHYGDVAGLDRDDDGVACESLPGAP